MGNRLASRQGRRNSRNSYLRRSQFVVAKIYVDGGGSVQIRRRVTHSVRVVGCRVYVRELSIGNLKNRINYDNVALYCAVTRKSRRQLIATILVGRSVHRSLVDTEQGMDVLEGSQVDRVQSVGSDVGCLSRPQSRQAVANRINNRRVANANPKIIVVNVIQKYVTLKSRGCSPTKRYVVS